MGILVKRGSHSFDQAWGVTLEEMRLLTDVDTIQRNGGVRLDREWLDRLKKQYGEG